MIRLEIPGDSVPAARPRFSGGHCYQPKRNREYRERVKSAAKSAMAGASPLDGELTCRIKIFRRYKRTARIFGDVDNHLKALFDGMNGIIFVDDAQVVRCVVEKYRDKERPRAEIEIDVYRQPEGT